MYVSKKDWIDMLRNRFWSHFVEIKDDRLAKGITEIEERYKEFETLSSMIVWSFDRSQIAVYSI